MTRSRWPAWVYGEGEQPDYRWSFANERTFLAWIRTALALVAAGVALDAVPLSMPEPVRYVIAVLVLLLGLGCAAVSWPRWAAAERAMRHRQPLPGLGIALPLTVLLCSLTLPLIVVAL